jgi:glycosyltransferase involved in cell wall biosynthesis
MVLYRGEWGSIGDEFKAMGTPMVHNPMKVYRPDQLLSCLWKVRKEKVDIVHSLNYRANFTDALIAKMAGAKFVSSRRNVRFWEGSDRLSWGERVRNSLTDLIIANAERLRQSTIQFENIPPEKVIAIYNGVPLDQADRALASDSWEEVRVELGIPSGAVVIGNMANLRPTKGQTYLLQAFRQVLDRTKGPLYLVITGQGPEEEALRAEVSKLGLEDKVRIFRTERDRFEVIRSYDIFVLSSLQEGFSNALVEAMVMGKACVATDVGGNAEAVVQGVTGLVIPPQDVDALAEALAKLVDDPEMRRIMGQTSAVRARKEFGMEEMVKEHQTAYEGLFGRA